MHKAYIGIGTNLEPRRERMEQALKKLSEFGRIERQSSIVETAPFGYTDQPDFLNAVVLLATNSALPQLHRDLKNAEKELGRTPRQRWHEREIDFDILFFDDVIVDSENLTVPHPEIPNRIFVLKPLEEIAPDFIHPGLQKTILQLLDELRLQS